MIDFSPIITQILDLIIPAAVGGAVGWFTTRKQQSAKIESLNAENASLRADGSKKIMDNYQEALDDLEKRYERRMVYMEKEYERRHQDLKLDYERKLELMKEEKLEQSKAFNALKKEVDSWKGKYEGLKSEFEQYKNRVSADGK